MFSSKLDLLLTRMKKSHNKKYDDGTDNTCVYVYNVMYNMKASFNYKTRD